MIQIARRLLLAVALALVVSASGLAQETAPMPQPAPPAAGGEGTVPEVPKIPDLPASLFAPAPPRAPAYNPLDVPYFMPEPLLDPPQFAPSGWFAGLELDVLKPHFSSSLTKTVQNAAQAATGDSTTVALPSAPLDWALSPKVVLGYRLPAGFGEVALAYRGLGTHGGAGILGPDGPATLNSQLDFNIFDLDYRSREFSLWPNWDMKWIVGLRTQFLFFDSRLEQPFDQATAGSTIFQMRETNRLFGIGPHAGLQLARRLADTGLAVSFWGDASGAWNQLHQGFFTFSTTPGPGGLPLVGETRDAFHIGTALLTTQAGVSWRPPSYPLAGLFLGYQYEFW